MKNISKNNKLAILGVSSFLISLGFEQLGFRGLELAALFCFGFSFGSIFFGKAEEVK
jgi:hypothetical protein